MEIIDNVLTIVVNIYSYLKTSTQWIILEILTIKKYQIIILRKSGEQFR